MFKKSLKHISIFIVLSVLLSAVFLPSLDAAQLNNSPRDTSPLMEPSALSVQFKREITRDVETHYYKFSTIGDAIIDVIWGPDTVGSDFIITDKNWSRMYWLGDVLPAGEYFFVITTNPAEGPDDPSIVNYDFTLSGLPFMQFPDTTLPRLDVISPINHVNRLPAGEQNVTFEGSSDASEVRFGIFGPDLPDKIIDNEFKETVNFTDASPTYSVFRLTAINDSGNRVNRNYEYIHPRVVRIDGKDIYEVSANAAAEYAKYIYNDEPEEINTVFLASGEDPSYSISGVPLAKRYNAPILLTKKDELPESIVKRMELLKPDNVVVVGGKDVISQKVVKKLKGLGISKIDRINGKNPFSISQKVAEKLDEDGAGLLDTAIVASGNSMYDAIIASGAAANLQVPLLLVEKDNVPKPIHSFLKKHTNYKRFIIIGNEDSVSEKVKHEILSNSQEIQAERISGTDPYEISANTARYFGFGIRNLAILNGETADSIAGSALATKLGATLLLTPSNTLDASIEKYLQEQLQNNDEILQVYIMGDQSSISDSVINRLKSYIK